jgi:hypothetical protein
VANVGDRFSVVMYILLLSHLEKNICSFPLSPFELIGYVLLNRQCATNMSLDSLPLITDVVCLKHQYIGAATHTYSNIKNKSRYWCNVFTFLCLLVQLAIFHQCIGAANIWQVMAKVLAFLIGNVQPCLQHIDFLQGRAE